MQGDLHARIEIRQEISLPRHFDCRAVGGIQAEEEDAGYAVESDIGAKVQLRESAPSWQWRESAGADSAHVKRRYRHPGAAVIAINFERSGHEPPHFR